MESYDRGREMLSRVSAFGWTRTACEVEETVRRAECVVLSLFSWDSRITHAENVIRRGETGAFDHVFGWYPSTSSAVQLLTMRECKKENVFGWTQRYWISIIHEQRKEVLGNASVFRWSDAVHNNIRKVNAEELINPTESSSPVAWSMKVWNQVFREIEKELDSETLDLSAFSGAKDRAAKAAAERKRTQELDIKSPFGWVVAVRSNENLCRKLEAINYDDPQQRTLERIKADKARTRQRANER